MAADWIGLMVTKKAANEARRNSGRGSTMAQMVPDRQRRVKPLSPGASATMAA
jgi:hypothetical protein